MFLIKKILFTRLFHFNPPIIIFLILALRRFHTVWPKLLRSCGGARSREVHRKSRQARTSRRDTGAVQGKEEPPEAEQPRRGLTAPHFQRRATVSPAATLSAELG